MRILILEPDGYSPEALAIYRSLGWVDTVYVWSHEIDVLVVRLGRQITADLMDYLCNLKYIVSPTTGLDHIDLDAAEKRGIKVLSLKGETEFLQTITATAELTWGLILALVRNIPAAFDSVKRGEWDRDAYKGHDLSGLVLGVIGASGRIGRQVTNVGDWLFKGVNTAYFSEGVDDVLENSDIVTLHVPFTEKNRNMIDARRLALMKPRSYLINTSRGDIIDEDALLDSLESGHIAGAALDVVCNERGERNPRLLEYARTHDNLIITPHIGGCTYESMEDTEIFMAKKLAKEIENEKTRQVLEFQRQRCTYQTGRQGAVGA